MPFAGTFPSSALLLPLLLVLWAEAQPVKGLMPNSGYCELLAGNATATGAAEMCMCYQRSAFDGEARLLEKDPGTVLLSAAGAAPSPAPWRAPSPTPERQRAPPQILPGAAPAHEKGAFDGEARLVDKDPGTVLLNATGAAPSPAPWRAPSPTPQRQRAPPPILPGAAPAHEKGLSWRAKAWVLLVLTVTMLTIVFLSRPETLQVSRIDDNGDSDSQSESDSDGDGDFFYCAICMETVPDIAKFSVGSCGHEFCFTCVAQYVAAKLGENLARVECPDPGCRGVGAVEPESCIGVISPDLLDKWGFLLCEAAFGAGKVYCPYRECSAPLLMDGQEAIAEAECPHCHRLFCAWCAVPWHAGIGCREFQQLGQHERGRDDVLLRLLAGQQRWQRCPKCQMYVEKSEGCNYIKCRCGYSFCYRCASKVSAQTHYCNTCKR